MAAPQPFEGTPLSSTDTGDMLRFMGKGATGDFAYCFEAVYGNADVTTKLVELHNFLMSMVCAGEGRFSVLFRLVVEIGTVALCFAVDSGAFDAKVWDRTELASALHTPTAVELYTVSLLCPREVAEAKASQFSSWALRQFSSQQEPGKPRIDAKANVAHWTKRTPALAKQIVSLLNSIDTVKASAVVAFADNGQSGDSTAWFKPMHSVFVSDTTRLESVRSIVNRLTVEMSGETPGETVQVGPRCDVLHSLHGDCQRPWGGSTNGELSADEIQSARKLFCDVLSWLPAWMLDEPDIVGAGKELARALFGQERLTRRTASRFCLPETSSGGGIIPSPRLLLLWSVIQADPSVLTLPVDYTTRKIQRSDMHFNGTWENLPPRDWRFLPDGFEKSLKSCGLGKSLYFPVEVMARIVHLVVSGRILEEILGVTVVDVSEWQRAMEKVPQLDKFQSAFPNLLPSRF